jgi:hypothetical protein
MNDENRPFWTFTQYPQGNKGAITKWRKKCKKYDGYADLEFETVVNTLSALANKQLWSEPEYKVMTNWEGIGELRFENEAGTPLRVFGFFREEEKEFVMLAGAVEDNRKYDPADIRKICIGRRNDIKLGRDVPVPFSFDDEDEELSDDDYIKQLFEF